MLNCVCVCVFILITSGAKYSLLAYTSLCLPEDEGSFQSHSLIVLQDGKKLNIWGYEGIVLFSA